MNSAGPTEPTGAVPRGGLLAAFGGLALILATGAVLFFTFRGGPALAPANAETDPLLRLGRAVYLDRCIGCHGIEGKGDGPTAVILKGQSPGNFTLSRWRRGEGVAEVQALIARGVEGTAMPAYGKILSDDHQRAVAAYVYFLGDRPIPDVLRAGPAPEPPAAPEEP